MKSNLIIRCRYAFLDLRVFLANQGHFVTRACCSCSVVAGGSGRARCEGVRLCLHLPPGEGIRPVRTGHPLVGRLCISVSDPCTYVFYGSGSSVFPYTDPDFFSNTEQDPGKKHIFKGYGMAKNFGEILVYNQKSRYR